MPHSAKRNRHISEQNDAFPFGKASFLFFFYLLLREAHFRRQAFWRHCRRIRISIRIRISFSISFSFSISMQYRKMHLHATACHCMPRHLRHKPTENRLFSLCEMRHPLRRELYADGEQPFLIDRLIRAIWQIYRNMIIKRLLGLNGEYVNQNLFVFP